MKPFPPRGPFPSNELPKVMDKDGMYVPQNCNFAAIDLIWKSGKKVCGVLVHTSNHHNLLEKFNVCNGWNKALLILLKAIFLKHRGQSQLLHYAKAAYPVSLVYNVHNSNKSVFKYSLLLPSIPFEVSHLLGKCILEANSMCSQQ